MDRFVAVVASSSSRAFEVRTGPGSNGAAVVGGGGSAGLVSAPVLGADGLDAVGSADCVVGGGGLSGPDVTGGDEDASGALTDVELVADDVVGEAGPEADVDELVGSAVVESPTTT